jgi:hypothetical protein
MKTLLPEYHRNDGIDGVAQKIGLFIERAVHCDELCTLYSHSPGAFTM